MINKVLHGDCLEKLKDLADNSVDAVVTDPPYGLSFMGKKWDYDVPSEDIWRECLRVLKPGGYLLAFAGTRTQHRMAVRIEDAGFEIRDMIAWVYGSGFPKSLNIGKAIDALQGNEREVVGNNGTRPIQTSGRINTESSAEGSFEREENVITKGNSEWEGFGTALKPALEPITVARKPLSEKTVALNVLKWGTGGIDIDGSRVEHNEPLVETQRNGRKEAQVLSDDSCGFDNTKNTIASASPLGRFPANFIHDGSDEVVAMFPNTKSGKGIIGNGKGTDNQDIFGKGKGGTITSSFADEGSASRFFYCAKASKSERNAGCEGMELKTPQHDFGTKLGEKRSERVHTPTQNNHPTVKPIALMEYLVKLVSKENAIILDPFGGSGSTAVACKNTNRNYILIEREEDYIPIINARIENVKPKLIPLTLF